MLRSLLIHRLLIATLLAVVTVLWLRQGSRGVIDHGESTVAAEKVGAKTGLKSLTETLREEGRAEFPIHFDADMNEFQLVYSYTNADGSHVVSRSFLYYDPFTGARLPESTRPSHFETPDRGDMAAISARLRDATKLEDVRRILGEPDDLFPANGEIRQQWTYSRLSKTMRVIVQETTNGLMKVCYVGQEKH